MGRRCCIEGCNSRSSAPEHHGVTYHSYPLDASIRAVWITNTRLPSDRNITKSVLVCSRHFRRADFQPMKSGKYLLKQRVFPTVFPWGKLDSTAITTENNSTAQTTSIDCAAAVATLPAVVPTPATTSAADPAICATVEATIAQIMADTAELNAAAGIKPMPPLVEIDTSLQLGKRVTTEIIAEEEPAAKVARSALESSPVAVAAIGISSTPGTKFEPVVVFNPGARLEAQDFDGIWHFARVVEVDNDDREVLIKFEKSGKHKSAALGSEEWIPMNSSRLRQKVSTKPIPVFEMEEKVKARWSGPRRFPGTIKKILENDTYEVLFDDGFVKNVRAIHMNKIPVAVTAEAPPTQVVAKQTIETTAGAAAAAIQMPTTPTADVALAKTKRTPPAGAAQTPSVSKPKRAAPGARKDWPLLELDKLDLESLNLPKIPVDGEWTCHWVNDQPIGKEGFLIVGEHRKPTVIVEDWRLPAGWIKHMYQRSNLLGKWDVILVAPNGKRFRSKADLKVYLEEQGIVYNPDIYDFSIHRRRAKDINAYVFTSDYTPQQPKTKPLTLDEATSVPMPIQIKTENLTLNDTPAMTSTELVTTLGSPSTTSQYIEPPVVTPMPPMELMTTPDTPVQLAAEPLNVNEVVAAAPTVTPAEDGFAYIGGLKVQIVDNLFRCPQEGCLKNFRKENHLQIHVKHYHRDFIKLLGDCPKMQELAEKRTLGTPDANEPQPKNQIPNQQFFAKLHQQDLEQSRAHRRSVSASLAATTTTTTTALATTESSAAAVVESVVQIPALASDDTKLTLSTHISADAATSEQAEDANNTAESSILDVTTATTDISQANTTADTTCSSMMELSVISSTADESNTDLSTSIVLPPKRPRFSPSKRTAGSRKSNRQRTTRRYLTAAQATAGAPQAPPPPTIVTADTINNSFGDGDFEETRHSFNATPDAKPADVANTASKKRKAAPTLAAAASATPLSSLDSPITADSGSSSFLPLPEEANSSVAPIPTPQYIKENGELIKIVRMRQEEIINCLCSYGEEDGLMIQCELCLCWQHGFCNGIEKESDVPDKYVCYICRNPQRGRASMRYKHDQDWIYEGKLPVANYHNPNPEHLQRFDLLKKSHTLTGNLVELKRFLHSLRVKINIANNKGHPKMYLWAKKWDDEDIKTEIKAEMQSNQLMCHDGTTIKVEDEEQKDLRNDDKTQTDANTAMPAKEIKTESIPPVRAPAPNIPQPEAPIEPVECQHRLLEHIKVQQNRVMERLSKIETEIDALDKLDNLPDLKNADMSTTKDVLSTFIKELEIMKQIAKVNSLENSKQALTNDGSIAIK